MLDQEKFFNTYKVQEAFEDSGLSWDTLEKIYEDYTRRLPEMKKIADRLQDMRYQNELIFMYIQYITDVRIQSI